MVIEKKSLYVYQIKPKMIMMPYLNCLNIDAGYYSWVDVVDKKHNGIQQLQFEMLDMYVYMTITYFKNYEKFNFHFN